MWLDRELAGALSPPQHAILVAGELLLGNPELDERLLQHVPRGEHHPWPQGCREIGAEACACFPERVKAT
jgi:hypothetical protein